MALSRGMHSDIPKDAVLLNTDQAFVYQWKIIKNWEDKTATWALRYAEDILAVSTGITAMYINKHFRTKFRLGRYGQVSSYLPTIIIPSILAVASHKLLVQMELVIDPLANCPVCLQTRAGAFQAGLSIVYPSILAPIASLMQATRYFTYRIPAITEAPKEVFQLVAKFTRPLASTLGTLGVVHFALAMFLTYKELEETIKIQIEMQRIEKEAEEKLEQERSQRIMTPNA